MFMYVLSAVLTTTPHQDPETDLLAQAADSNTDLGVSMVPGDGKPRTMSHISLKVENYLFIHSFTDFY